MITAKVIADSILANGTRITTFQLRYPRYVHADFMTHRLFSRNASSSRAKPVKAFLSEGIVYPIEWGANIPGMQAGQELTGWRKVAAKLVWSGMARLNGLGCTLLAKIGLHKQWANRPLEWFTHINVVVTATTYDNFYALRCHKDAQPEIQALAKAMYQASTESTPVKLLYGEWHLPYISKIDRSEVWDSIRNTIDKSTLENPTAMPWVQDILTYYLIKVSVARCARVSYLSHDGKKTTVEADIALYDRLLASVPLHASPAEHQATSNPMNNQSDANLDKVMYPELQGNLIGAIQYRKLLEGEHQDTYTP
jgi:hypothetical protein